jgi:Tfp pilus assembly protein PilF
MYQRALQGFEKAIGPDNIITYVPALDTSLNLGVLFERQADLAKARTMFSKALRGYKLVFGPEHAKSKTLRDKLYALDDVVANKALVEIEERADDLPIGSSHPGIKKPPLTSKRHKLFQKLTLRFRP